MKLETPEEMAQRLWAPMAVAHTMHTRLVCMEDAIRARDKAIADALETEAEVIWNRRSGPQGDAVSRVIRAVAAELRTAS
jgi:hypothetical protein